MSSDKPSLYVVEKKEVVILVVLFVLVTVLSFTMGVRYGESVGKKTAQNQAAAEEEHSSEAADSQGGTLGEERKEEHKEHGKEAAKGKEKEGKEGKEEAEAPKAAPAKSEGPAPGREAADKNSDEYLLNALKEAGVEPPGGKAPGNAKLPEDTKRAKSGTFVIQVGSHPTRGEAESQVRTLKGKKVEAEILPPFKDRQGEWHRVVIGSFKNKRDAEKEAAQLKARGAVVSYFVWRLP